MVGVVVRDDGAIFASKSKCNIAGANGTVCLYLTAGVFEYSADRMQGDSAPLKVCALVFSLGWVDNRRIRPLCFVGLSNPSD